MKAATKTNDGQSEPNNAGAMPINDKHIDDNGNACTTTATRFPPEQQESESITNDDDKSLPSRIPGASMKMPFTTSLKRK